jgi:molecular chaperone DnaK
VEWGPGVAEVKASAGDDRLGGDDFDQLIVVFALEAIGKEIGKVELDAFQQLVLAEAARQAKIELTGTSETTLFLPGFVQTSHGPVDLNVRLDRQTFESLGKPLMERAKQVLNQALTDSGLRTRPSKLLLIGGSSRIPYVRNMVRQVVGLESITGLDPESGVCEGACILSGVFNGSSKDLVLLDVTPTSYSVGLKDDAASVLIPRNTTIPTKTTVSFTTTEDNQTELTVRIFEGEKPKTSQNSFVGQVRLTGLPRAKSGTPAIEVCFDIDGHGTLRASATDGATGKNVTALLESPYRLNPAPARTAA